MRDFIRIAAACPETSVGNVAFNVNEINKKIEEAVSKKVDVILFPELSVTGYTCADLFFQQTLLTAALDGLKKICDFISEKNIVVLVGLPVVVENKLFNAGAVCYKGKVLGIVPKTYIPTYNEFYERRWFSSAFDLNGNEVLPRALGLEEENGAVPIGNDLIFDFGAFVLGAEVCEDFWAAITPGNLLALNGAEVLFNLSASNEIAGKRAYRRNLVEQSSAKGFCVYAYASSGSTESTTDLVFSGHCMIAENGKIVAENDKVIDNDYLLVSDVDLGKIRADRMKIKTYSEGSDFYGKSHRPRRIIVNYEARENDLSYYAVKKLPFVPGSGAVRKDRCEDIFEMQVAGLKKRMDTVRSHPVIGVSGGLDSTLALLVAVEAAHRAGKPSNYVYGITMPCFGTTNRTYRNSLSLMEKLGVTSVEIPIKDAVSLHFRDIGQDESKRDLTYENSQARERTQVLMDYAGKIGGFVVGTGDLSELALGWCTYNADHMSMYGVNAGVPKTLVRWMIDVIKDFDSFKECKEVLDDILDTPISPELLPPDAEGKIAQATEDIVGPYALHDFFLYYTLRYGFAPKKVFTLAKKAFESDFDACTIKKWLVNFYKRFFTQQFKRSCLPDGVKIGSVCLSPRGDWRMPSDASSEIWLSEAESLEV